MNQILLKQLESKCFVYTNKSLFQLSAKDIEVPVTFSTLPKLAVLIIGRDCYQEVERVYPVIDQRDLDAILKNELSNSWISSKPVIDGSQTRLKLWIPNDSVNDIIEEHRVVWIPETLLFHLGSPAGFFEFNRLGETLFHSKNDGKSVSSMATGAYKSAAYFLLSAGIENATEPKKLDTKEYVSFLKKGLLKIDLQHAGIILKGQNSLHYLKTLFHWPSAILGAFSGLFLVTLMQLGWQQLSISSLESEAKNQDVRSIIELEKRVTFKKELMQSLSDGSNSLQSSVPTWRLLADAMENKITVIEFSMQEGSHLFRFQSASAIDALELIRALPYIRNAEFTTSVQNSRGKERYSIKLDFKSED